MTTRDRSIGPTEEDLNDQMEDLAAGYLAVKRELDTAKAALASTEERARGLERERNEDRAYHTQIKDALRAECDQALEARRLNGIRAVEWERRARAAEQDRAKLIAEVSQADLLATGLEQRAEAAESSLSEERARREEAERIAAKPLDHEYHTSCGHTWTVRNTACPKCFEEQRTESLRFYRADGSYLVLDSPRDVVERRIGAARELERLREAMTKAVQEILDAKAQLSTLTAALEQANRERDEAVKTASAFGQKVAQREGEQRRRAETAEADLERAREALRELLAEEDRLRDAAKHMTTWNGVRDWYRAHPADSEPVARARALATLGTEAASTGPAADRFDCLWGCGIGIAVDEDGCCAVCGRDAVVIQGHVPRYPPMDEETPRDDATLALPLAAPAASTGTGEGKESDRG